MKSLKDLLLKLTCLLFLGYQVSAMADSISIPAKLTGHIIIYNNTRYEMKLVREDTIQDPKPSKIYIPKSTTTTISGYPDPGNRDITITYPWSDERLTDKTCSSYHANYIIVIPNTPANPRCDFNVITCIEPTSSGKKAEIISPAKFSCDAGFNVTELSLGDAIGFTVTKK